MFQSVSQNLCTQPLLEDGLSLKGRNIFKFNESGRTAFRFIDFGNRSLARKTIFKIYTITIRTLFGNSGFDFDTARKKFTCYITVKSLLDERDLNGLQVNIKTSRRQFVHSEFSILQVDYFTSLISSPCNRGILENSLKRHSDKIIGCELDQKDFVTVAGIQTDKVHSVEHLSRCLDVRVIEPRVEVVTCFLHRSAVFSPVAKQELTDELERKKILVS